MHNKEKPKRLAYILAASHSGSTLLAMLLGSHREACTVGELKATNLGDVESYSCSCGSLITKCGFWKQVSDHMLRRGIKFDIACAGTDVRGGGSNYTNRFLRSLHRGALLERVRDTALALSPTWRRRLPLIQRTNTALFETICQITGKRVVVDSSKVGIRLKYLLRNPDLDVRVIRLIRDGRAVALSYMDAVFSGGVQRRDSATRSHDLMTMAAAAHRWKRSAAEADAIIAGLSPSRKIEVRYEEYCRNTSSVLTDVLTFLDLDPTQSNGEFRSGTHHIIGNYMRMESTSEIWLDERWRDALTAEERQEFDRVAGRLNRKYGYD